MGASRIKLLGSTDGRGIKVAATASPGTAIHTAISGTGADNFDELYLEAYNSDTTARTLTYDAAWKVDRGRDVRSEASMIKVFGTEMAWEIIDRAMQTFGAMGMTKELPLQLMASQVRLMRIYEGPSEIHRWVVARNLLGLKK